MKNYAIRPTLLVRHIMYSHGGGDTKWGVFTNKYDKCHTVKMYAFKEEKRNQNLAADITYILNALKIPFTIKRHKVNNRWFSTDAFIVRLP